MRVGVGKQDHSANHFPYHFFLPSEKNIYIYILFFSRDLFRASIIVSFYSGVCASFCALEYQGNRHYTRIIKAEDCKRLRCKRFSNLGNCFSYRLKRCAADRRRRRREWRKAFLSVSFLFTHFLLCSLCVPRTMLERSASPVCRGWCNTLTTAKANMKVKCFSQFLFSINTYVLSRLYGVRLPW